MKQLRVLVTGIGAVIGYGIIQSLRNYRHDIYIVGMDIYADAVGQHWCDKFIKAEMANSLQYAQFLQSTINENEIDLVFFGTEQEIHKASFSQDTEVDKSKLVLNNREIIELTKDKWVTYKYLCENGFSDIAIPSAESGTYCELSNCFGNTFMLKPKRSYASKGIVVVDDEEAFLFYKKRMGDNFMAQKLIGDDQHEYTFSLFGLGDGNFVDGMCLNRQLSKEGSTAKAHVIEHQTLLDWAHKLTKKLKPIGPTNFQFRGNESELYLLEINPRISSATSIRTALGQNESKMCIEWFLFKRNPDAPHILRGSVQRYIADWITLK